MIVQEITLYEFYELDELLQNRLIDKYRDSLLYDNWHDIILDDIEEDLKVRGYENIDVRYSGFGSQGDGLSFSAYLPIKKVLLGEFEPLQKIIASVRWIRQPSIYVNAGTCDLETDIEWNAKDKDLEELSPLLAQLENYLNREYIDLCHTYYHWLQDEYEHLTSDQNVIEYLREFKFLEDGHICA